MKVSISLCNTGELAKFDWIFNLSLGVIRIKSLMLGSSFELKAYYVGREFNL